MNQGKQIQELVKGQTPSLVDTDKGNELIRVINSLQKIEVQRNGEKDFIQYSENNVLLNLQEMPEGGDFSANEIEMWVCHNGIAERRIFYVK